MFTKSRLAPQGVGRALVVGVALFAALATTASAAPRHHKARHVSPQVQRSYAAEPHQAAPDPFAHDPTMYLVRHHIPVPDKGQPGL